MTIETRVATVKQLPETLNMKQGRIFLREINSCMEIDRPRIVLDCSSVRKFDNSMIHLLLHCLEEAMKRKGDIRLASLQPGAGALLERTGAIRLFDIFDTTADAVNSFHHLPLEAVPQALWHSSLQRESAV